jgi:hypothetical protein
MKALPLVVLLFVIAWNAFGSIVAAEPTSAPGYVMLVHPDNPIVEVERDFLANAFLKKVTRWPRHGVLKVVDLPAGSPTRARFSQEVLLRPVAAVRAYWQQRIFSGIDVPPPELDSDALVVAWVLAHEGALGYVSSTAELGRAKRLRIRP